MSAVSRNRLIHIRMPALVGALLAVSILPGAASSAASAVTSCSVDSGILSVALPADDPDSTISRLGSRLVLDGEVCAAKLSKIALISVSDAPTHDANLTIHVPSSAFKGVKGKEIAWRLALGGGTDTVTLQGRGGRNAIKIVGNRANLNARANSTLELFGTGVEAMELRGGAGDDRLGISETLRVNDDDSRTASTASTAGTGIGSYPTARIFGGAGDDTLRGDGNVNVIWAGPGNDEVFAAGADDEIQGGDGDDTIFGGEGDDLLNGGPGNDNEFGGVSNDLFQQGPQDVYTSATPVAIPDVGKALSSVTVPETTLSSVDVNVRVYIDHPATQDLWVTLIAPNNNRVRLAERRGNGTPFDGTQFDSEAFTNIKVAGAKHLSGRFHPEWSMELVQASNPTGQWTLWVEDKAGGSVGTIKGWELELGMPTSEGDGSDDISGGNAVNDLVVYSQRTENVTATLNGGADDGQTLEGDDLGTPCPPANVGDAPPPNCSDLEWVYTGAGDDTITGTDSKNDLRGAPGHDTITALGEVDQIRGANGQDIVSAGDGNDVIHGQGNPDTIDGGDGFDRAMYGYAPVGMDIDISNPASGTASDGAAGNDDDTLMLIENITGTSKNDTIIGNAFSNSFFGTGGDDFLDGAEGNDTLDGAGGTDTCLNGETTPGCEIFNL